LSNNALDENLGKDPLFQFASETLTQN